MVAKVTISGVNGNAAFVDDYGRLAIGDLKFNQHFLIKNPTPSTPIVVKPPISGVDTIISNILISAGNVGGSGVDVTVYEDVSPTAEPTSSNTIFDLFMNQRERQYLYDLSTIIDSGKYLLIQSTANPITMTVFYYNLAKRGVG